MAAGRYGTDHITSLKPNCLNIKPCSLDQFPLCHVFLADHSSRRCEYSSDSNRNRLPNESRKGGSAFQRLKRSPAPLLGPFLSKLRYPDYINSLINNPGNGRTSDADKRQAGSCHLGTQLPGGRMVIQQQEVIHSHALAGIRPRVLSQLHTTVGHHGIATLRELQPLPAGPSILQIRSIAPTSCCDLWSE
jgi:hypothetical protein